MNVLLVRADGIGDALVCAPLVAALHDAGHRVSAVLGTRNRDAFARAAFEHVHVLERIPWPAHGSTKASRMLALADATAAKYDVALVASEELEAYAFGRAAHIAQRVGFTNGWEKPLKSLQVAGALTRRIVRPAAALRAREHEVETLFRLGTGFVTAATPTRDATRLRRLVVDDDAGCHGAIVVQASRKFVAAGLGREAYVALVRSLVARGNATIVIGEDGAFARGVARAGGAEERTGLTTAAWKTCIAGARAFVTPDSGAAHVAGMTGVATVDCFAPGRATAQDIARWHPWAAPYRAYVLGVEREPAQIAAELGALTLALLGARAPARSTAS